MQQLATTIMHAISLKIGNHETTIELWQLNAVSEFRRMNETRSTKLRQM